jgi:hypothetical protein
MQHVPLNRRRCVPAAALLFAALVLLASPSAVFAQDVQQGQGHGRLYWPTLAASSAATADWITTYHALKFYRVQEQNPLLKPFQSNPARMVSMGALMDIAGVSAWNLTIGQKHQRVGAAGLWTMTAFRVFLAVHNHNNEHRAQRREP